MPLKRNEACLVCGKDGTAKSTAKRFDLPLDLLEGRSLESAVRRTAHLEKESLALFRENSRGERRLSEKDKDKLRQGEYLRVVGTDTSGEMSESIIKLT